MIKISQYRKPHDQRVSCELMTIIHNLFLKKKQTNKQKRREHSKLILEGQHYQSEIMTSQEKKTIG